MPNYTSKHAKQAATGQWLSVLNYVDEYNMEKNAMLLCNYA